MRSWVDDYLFVMFRSLFATANTCRLDCGGAWCADVAPDTVRIRPFGAMESKFDPSKGIVEFVSACAVREILAHLSQNFFEFVFQNKERLSSPTRKVLAWDLFSKLFRYRADHCFRSFISNYLG